MDLVAKFHMARGDSEAAISWQEKANQLGEEAVAAQPDAIAPQLALRIGLNKLGGFAQRGGRHALSAKSFERAYHLAKRLIESHPNHPEVRMAWSEALDALGIARWTQARMLVGEARRPLLLEAKKLFEDALEVTMAMTKDKVLPSSHTGWGDVIRTKIATCELGLKLLDDPTAVPEDK
jgi:tetratricopeptide (TPR) repeat protein